MSKVNWDYWLSFDDVSPDEAVCLSCNIEPFRFTSLDEKLCKRRDLIYSLFQINFEYISGFLTGTSKRISKESKNKKINLKALSEKAIEKKIQIPAELAALASAVGNTDTPMKANSNTPDKPLRTTERNTLLTIIAGLCKEAEIDITKRGAAKRVALATVGLGCSPVSEETARRMLSNVKNALETRMK